MLQVKNEESDEIDGTTNRVASVTLESDSLSEAPRSFRSKRRKRISKREKSTKMDVDKEDEGIMPGTSGCGDKECPSNNKIHMDWEASAIISDIDFSSDHSRSGDNDDADDEQSDWPDYNNSCGLGCSVKFGTIYDQLNPPASLLAPPGATKSSTLSANVVRRIERFVADQQQKELILFQVYRTSLVKKLLKQSPPVQILKRGRGTIILKKI